jgi:hypothetical protein
LNPVLGLASDSCESSISFSPSVWAAKSYQFPQPYNTLNKRAASLIIEQSAIVPYSVPFLSLGVCQRRHLPHPSPLLILQFISYMKYLQDKMSVGFDLTHPFKECHQRLDKYLHRPVMPGSQLCLRHFSIFLFQSFSTFQSSADVTSFYQDFSNHQTHSKVSLSWIPFLPSLWWYVVQVKSMSLQTNCLHRSFSSVSHHLGKFYDLLSLCLIS